jgi:hypothetical protein
MTTPSSYVRYSDDLEQPFPDEENLIRQITDAMEHANQQVAAKHRHGLRDAHAKSHGVLAGELRIQPDLPGHLAQGLFAGPRSYPVIVRLSTAPGDLRSDQVPVQRGMAIKVLGATGPRAVDDGLSTQDLVAGFFSRDSAEYALRAQLCTDTGQMPVEDASVPWPEELSPHQTVAVLHLPAQDPYSDARRRYADDVLSFSPWHALAAHRPLGSIMRSRRAAYPRSSGFRHHVNGIEQHEPSSIDELPA